MVTAQIAALVLALSAPGDTVLLDFHASWCAPCRAMESTITSLERSGYPVRRVDVDREGNLASQHRVQNIPCFVLIVDGKEAGRVTGAVSQTELQAMFARAGVGPSVPTVRGQSPDMPRTQPPFPGQATQAFAQQAQPHGQPPLQQAGLPPRGIETSGRSATISPEQLIESSVRLTIADPNGVSYGSGTIIDARSGEALVLTCGHIFRDSAGKGQISIDLLAPGAPQKIQGRIVSYDLKNDIGLVSFRPGVPVRVATLAPAGHQTSPGDRVTTVGCNNGGPPTAEATQVTAVNKFLGPANLQVAGLPVQGRSGGGLFAADGCVIGVCNAADPADNEGLYAALPVIQEELDKVGLTALLQNRQPANPLQAVAAVMPENANIPGPASASPAGLNAAALAELQARAGDAAEVICIVRPLADPRAKSEVFMLDRASPALLEQLAADRQAQQSRHLTSLNVPLQSGSSAAVRR